MCGQVKHVNIEHIALALLETPDNELEKLINELGLDVKKLKAKIDEVISSLNRDRYPKSRVDPQHMAITPRVKMVVEQAQLEADRLGDRQIRTTHLFWAMIYIYSNTEKQAAVAKIFRDFDITPAKVHDRILKG